MTLPRTFRESFAEFERIYIPDDISVILIPSSKGTHYEKMMLGLLSDYNYTIPESRIFQYIPPRTVGHDPHPRTEHIPLITNGSGTYVLIDDIVETGQTLDIAMQRLNEQGILSSSIWIYVCGLLSSRPTPLGPFLDKAETFLQHMQEVRKIKNKA